MNAPFIVPASFETPPFILSDWGPISTPLTRGKSVKIPRRVTTDSYWRGRDCRRDYDFNVRFSCALESDAVARVFVSDKSDEEGTCVLEVALNRSEFLRYLPGKFFAQLSPADELWIRVDINCQSRTDVRVVLEKAR